MKQIILLPLLLCTLVIGCLAQTFQYSRGWTNGKRSSSLTNAQQRQQEHPRYISRDDTPIDPELFEENVAERYFLQLPRILRKALLARSSQPEAASGLSSRAVENGGNNLFGNRHQSNEIFDDVNGVSAVEPNDFAKH